MKVGDKVMVRPGLYHVIEYSIDGTPVYTDYVYELKKRTSGVVKEILPDGQLNIELEDAIIEVGRLDILLKHQSTLKELAEKLKREYRLKYAFLVPVISEPDKFAHHKEIVNRPRGPERAGFIAKYPPEYPIPRGWCLVLTNNRYYFSRKYAIPEEQFDRLNTPELKAKILSYAFWR